MSSHFDLAGFRQSSWWFTNHTVLVYLLSERLYGTIAYECVQQVRLIFGLIAYLPAQIEYNNSTLPYQGLEQPLSNVIHL